MSHLNLEISPRQVIAPRMVLTTGLGLIIAPISVAAYMYIPQQMRGAAIGLASLLRNEGASVGTSLAQTLEIRREQFHTARVGEFLDPLNPTVTTFIDQSQGLFLRAT